MSIRHYIFDFDGTLVDSMPTHGEKIIHLLKLQGIEAPEGLLTVLTPLGDKGGIPYLREHFPVTMTEEQMTEVIDAYALPRYQHDIPAKDGVLEYLSFLKKQGMHTYILTASPHRLVDPCAERLGMTPLFDAIWSCEEFGTVKSDRALYSLVAKRIGCSLDEIAFFDDNRIAIETASTTDLYTVGVYDKTSDRETESIRAAARRYIHSFTELCGELLS